MKTISHTSQWTAAARSLESERDDALFHDPLARTLAYPEGFKILDNFGGGGLIEFVAIRTKFIDNFIIDCTYKNNIKQIVILAAGMDTRAYRLSWPSDCILYELDYKALHIEKDKRLRSCNAQPSILRKPVYTDLNEDKLAPLIHSGFDSSKPTLWIVEALLFFLNEPQVQNLLHEMKRLSIEGSYMTTDILNAQLLKHPSTQLFLKKLSAQGTPWQFGLDDPEKFLNAHGWDVIDLKQPGEEGANWGRWPYYVYPKSAPNIPRNWLVTAKLALS